MGHNPALDAALKCLLGVHQSLISGKLMSSHEDLRDCHPAVSLIRKDLSFFRHRTPSETICAAMILCLYEVGYRKKGLLLILTTNSAQTVFNQDRTVWMTHARGVSAILQAWGPNCIVTEFYLALFTSHYETSVSVPRCLIIESDCVQGVVLYIW